MTRTLSITLSLQLFRKQPYFTYFSLANFIQKNMLEDPCYSEFQFNVFHSLESLPKSGNILMSLIIIEKQDRQHKTIHV